MTSKLALYCWGSQDRIGSGKSIGRRGPTVQRLVCNSRRLLPGLIDILLFGRRRKC